jgi:surface antigen
MGLAAALLLGAEAHAGPTCVPFARAISAVKLAGDAWSWWGAAEGRYQRSRVPAPGAVLVMKRTERLRYGHVAVVVAVLNSREILLDHANWNPGEIARGERAIDVSENNDWSEVRVWHDASASYGVNVYPSYGFVHPSEPRAVAAESQKARSTMAQPVLPEFKPERPVDAKAPTPRAKPRRTTV